MNCGHPESKEEKSKLEGGRTKATATTRVTTNTTPTTITTKNRKQIVTGL